MSLAVCLSSERQEKDERIISLILHIIRNLLSIKDAVGSTFTSGDAFEKSTLQVSRLA